MGAVIHRRTVFSLVTIVLFALRAWTMFYLMRLVNLGSYSVLTISFLLCGITAVLFFGSCDVWSSLVGWSLSSKQYAIRSFFSYWKALLVCGALKALQLYLWVSALSSCGPVITVFFEQSPKVAFVIIGLIAHSFTSNRIL